MQYTDADFTVNWDSLNPGYTNLAPILKLFIFYRVQTGVCIAS